MTTKTNSGSSKKDEERYIAIVFDRINKQYFSYVKIDGITTCIGTYDSMREASIARERKLKELKSEL